MIDSSLRVIDIGMIGYHYTTQKAYKQILKKGLVPGELTDAFHGQLRDATILHKVDLKAVWVWRSRPYGNNHVGNILRVVAMQASPKVVLLEVEYDKEDTYCPLPFKTLSLIHDGRIGRYLYHKHSLAHLVTKTIPPNRIKLLQSVDLLELLRS